jgi:PAS domain S-box-containing protein
MNQTTPKFEMLLSPRRLFFRVLVAVFLAELVVHFFIFRVEKLVLGGFPQELLDSATLSLMLAPFLWWWIIRPLGSAAMHEKMLAAKVINTSVDSIITIDDRGRITAFNPAAERLFGYAKQEVLGQNVNLLMPPPEREQHDAHLGRYLRTGEKKVIGLGRELVAQRKDGATFPIYLSLSEARDGDRRIFTGIVHDLTDRKRTEKEQARLTAILQATTDLVATADLKGFVQYINQAGRKMLGLGEDQDVTNTRIADYHAEWAASIVTNVGIPAAIERGFWRGDTALLSPDGREIPVSQVIIAHTAPDGTIEYLSTIGRDITERSQAQDKIRKLNKELEKQIMEVRRAEERYHSIFENAVEGIFQTTADGRFIAANPAMARLLGYDSPGDLMASVTDAKSDVYVDQGSRAEFERQLQESDRVSGLELKYWRKDGSLVVVSESARAVRDESGTLLYYEGIAEDITERKRGEERLAAQYLVTRALADSVTLAEATPKILRALCETLGWVWGALWIVDREANVLRCHEVCHDPSAEMAQFETASRELTFAPGVGLPGRVWADGKPARVADVAQDKNFLRAAIAARENLHSALAIPIEVGSKVLGVMEFFRRAIREPDPECLAVMATVSSKIGQFIERKRAEEALRESEERYRDLVENAHDIIYSHDLHGNYVSTNKAGEQISGYTREEALKLNFVDTVAPEYLETARLMLARKLAGATTTAYELEVIAKDGHRIPVEVNTRLVLRDGVPVGVQGIARDVTERKRTEADLVRLAAAVEQTADSVVITDPKGNIQYVNPAFERITGYAKEEALDQSSRILRSGKTDQAVYKELWETITRGEVWVGQLTNRKKDGTLFEERVTISPVRDKTDRIVNYIAVKQDISDLIKLEEQLRQSQKMEAIGQLAGGVAHDFNNLLTAINGYSGLALQRIDDNHPLKGYLEEIKKAGDRAANLTRQLLAFGRKQILQPLPINLNDVVTDMNKMLRRLIGEDIELTAKLDPALKKIKADPGQIEQVLVNLIVNARDAMPQGGNLTIETVGVDLDQDYANRHVGVVPGSYVMLAVSDTGTGMDEDTQARIFDPFFTTKEKGKGTGLGLSTVYGIVKQSGGNIWVYSELGHGTTFKVYLPELAAGSQKTEAVAVESPIPGGSETILLVEDEDVVRGLARKILEHAGYNVLEASRGEEAIRLCLERAEPIDLLLTDVVMPETSGKEVADRLTKLFPGLRVLFMSGYTDEAIVHHGVLDSNVEFIQKPFTPGALVRKVRAVLDSELVIGDSVSLLPKGEGEIEVEHEHHDA